MVPIHQLSSLSTCAKVMRLSLRLFLLSSCSRLVKVLVCLLNNWTPTPSVPISRFPLLSSVMHLIFLVLRLFVPSLNLVKELVAGLYKLRPPKSVLTQIFFSLSSKITHALLVLMVEGSDGLLLKCLYVFFLR